MPSPIRRRRWICRTIGLAAMLGACWCLAAGPDAMAGPFAAWFHRHHVAPDPLVDGPPLFEIGGEWHWLRNLDQEKVVAASLFNRYCIRCHGIDGRGVWDVPGVPDFTNKFWLDTRTDAMFARRIIEGRGAVMPTFRGVVSLEEAYALARHIRTLAPAAETSPPVLAPPKKVDAPKK